MRIEVQFSKSNMRIDAEFKKANMPLDAEFSNYQEVTIRKDVDPFMGEYEITPDIDAQTIPTAQKYMTEDMRIKAIPFYDVSNTSGGSTVYIGKEI